MPVEKITFPGHSGETLAARLDRPEGPPRAAAILAHCFTCSKDIPAARRIAGRLAAQGIAVLRFDFTGLGHSGGEFANTSFTSNVDDIAAAAEALRAQGLDPQLLVGHSLGGAAVLAAAPRIPGIRAVVTIGAPADPGHVTHHFAEALPRIEAEGSAEVSIGGRPFRVGRQFVHDVAEARLLDAVRHMRAALLVMHAPRDQTVGIENATEIFTAAKHPKSFVTLDGADHLVTNAADADYAAGVIAAWSARYLDLAEPPPKSETPEGVVRVAESSSAGFLQDISLGPRHHLVADEPQRLGGTDFGPTPYGLLAASLGACTSMTIRMYARRKGWPLTHVRADITQNKVHAQDAGGSDKIDQFTRVIHLDGPLTPDQRQRLLEIADKCPVHHTLTRSSMVKTVLAE